MLFRFCLYGFLKNQRYFEPFLMLVFIQQGLSFFMIGLLVASQHLTVNLLEIPSGVLADSWGRRGCMIVSLSAYILSFVAFAFASSPAWFFPAMILFGVGECFRTGTHKAMIFEWLRLQGREAERTRVYGLTRSWSKFGSALSSILAAVFVLATGSYRSIFLIGIIPYAINIVNILSYPRELDGAHKKAASLREAAGHSWAAIRAALSKPRIRGLTVESMCWDGLFHAVKDYLQPVLAIVAASAMVRWFPTSEHLGNSIPATRSTTILVGITYTLLFLLSGWASQWSHRLVARFGSEQAASRWLWMLQAATFGVFIMADLFAYVAVVAVVFIVMNVTQNLWRPILIGRYDECAPPEFGATIMSMESQSRRLATLVLAPLLGYAVDWASDSSLIGNYWPIGVAGLILSLTMVMVMRDR